MASFLYSLWLCKLDKDMPEFYRDANFRLDYADREMPRRAKAFAKTVRSQVEEMTDSLPEGEYELRVLSLGCGPGSDFIGVCNAIQRAIDTGDDPNALALGLSVKWIGVDCNDWNWHAEGNTEARNRLISIRVPVTYEFHVKPMETYVRDATEQGQEFDLVVMNYAGVKDKIDFVTEEVPQLLRQGGRIFVIDNNVQALNRLTQRGFDVAARNRSFVFYEFVNDFSDFSDFSDSD